MYKDYLDAILEYYEIKKKSKDLSPRLLNPTPSKIRDECAFVYRTRFEKKDLPRLMSFFEVYEDSDLLRAIERFDIDKFRPLNNYLRESTEKTEDKNIELLGWLLDFPKRPYNEHDFPYAVISAKEPEAQTTTEAGRSEAEEQDDIGKPASDAEGFELQKNERPIPNLHVGQTKLALIVAAVVIASGLLWIIFINKENKGCMVWVGDHYERVSCDSSGSGPLVLGLDTDRVHRLRRITRPDTLTESDIGKVWYRKRGADSLDFYTTGGVDPIDPKLDLKRLTVYIFNKYLKKINTKKADPASNTSR